MHDQVRSSGFTLIELMIAVAILAVIASLAIPAYNGYIRESRLSVLRTNVDSLRVFIEDYQLENGSYTDAAWSADGTTTTLNSVYGWKPDGDKGTISYAVEASDDGSTYAVTAQDTGDSDAWVRCENRMANCCYPGSGGSVSSCSGP